MDSFNEKLVASTWLFESKTQNQSSYDAKNGHQDKASMPAFHDFLMAMSQVMSIKSINHPRLRNLNHQDSYIAWGGSVSLSSFLSIRMFLTILKQNKADSPT